MSLSSCERVLANGAPGGATIGAVLVEPVQGRGGVRIPPPGFFEALSGLAHRYGAVVVADEVFTGLGRCGAMFAGPALGLDADLICLGKALGGGYPLSACLGKAAVMDAWPESAGEALHTSTFLGHPVACAAALAFLDLVEDERLDQRAARMGKRLVARLGEELSDVPHVAGVRGLGLLAGIEISGPGSESAGATRRIRRTGGRPVPSISPVTGGPRAESPDAPPLVPAPAAGPRIAERLLADGVLVLPAGEHGQVIELTPPATMSSDLLDHALDRVAQAVTDLPF